MSGQWQAWSALVIVVAALAFTFGVRSYLSFKATGDSGLRLDAGPAGSVAWWGKILFVAAMVLTAAAPLAVPTGLLSIGLSDRPALHIGGLLIAIAGLGIVAAAQSGMGASWRIGVDKAESTSLVTQGLFAYVRNPIFTGMTVFSTGLVLLLPTLVSLAALVVLIVAIQLQVRGVEEPYLLATHGHSYQEYAARAGRFLPAIGRLQPRAHR